MVLQRLLGCQCFCTHWASVCERVGEMFAFNVIAHVRLGRVGKHVADSTSWNSMFIQAYEAVEVFRLGNYSWQSALKTFINSY